MNRKRALTAPCGESSQRFLSASTKLGLEPRWAGSHDDLCNLDRSQLRDTTQSGGNQSTHNRVINGR